MTISNMAFDPVDGLRNKSTYPTDPLTEDALRDAVQRGMDQLRDHVNNKVAAKALDKNGDTMTGKLLIALGSLGTNAGDILELQEDNATTGGGNSVKLITRLRRTTAGSSWDTVAIDLIRRTDTTDQAYLTFHPDGNMYLNGNKGVSAPSGGYKIQSGKVSAPTASTYQVTFPTAFTIAPIVVGILFNNGAAGTGVVATTLYSTTGASFNTNSSAAGAEIHWLAIGT